MNGALTVDSLRLPTVARRPPTRHWQAQRVGATTAP
jgi:hypothetical protein